MIFGGQNLSRRQSVFFLPVDPRKENHKDPEFIDYSVPRHARCVQNTWKRHQDTVFWIDIDLAIREGLTFYQTRSNAIILQGTLPANCILRAERLKSGEKLHERQYLSPRPPPKISLRHDLNWNKGQDQGSTVEHRPVGKLVQQSLEETLQSGSSKPTQSPKLIEDRPGKPVTQEIVGKLQEELSSSDRSGKPEKRKNNTTSEITMNRGNPMERKVVQEGKVVIKRISLTLRRTTRTLTSTSPVFPMRRWNVLKTLTFMTWLRESQVIHSKKQFRMTSKDNNHSMHSATSQRLQSWMQETLRFARLSKW